MKKALALLLAAILLLSLTACGGNAAPSSDPTPEADDAANADTPPVEEEAPEEAEPELSEFAQAAIFATKRVKQYLDDNLKNPCSLIINSIKGGVSEDLSYIFEIDYNAENSFGGSVRDQIYISLTGSSDEGYGVKSYGDPSFEGSQNQSFTKQFFNDLAFLGEIFFTDDDGNEEPIEFIPISPEELAGIGIFKFDVDTILENVK